LDGLNAGLDAYTIAGVYRPHPDPGMLDITGIGSNPDRRLANNSAFAGDLSPYTLRSENNDIHMH
jgi:hypothetical protein